MCMNKKSAIIDRKRVLFILITVNVGWLIATLGENDQIHVCVQDGWHWRRELLPLPA